MSKKRCVWCGHWFRPAVRRWKKQRSCRRVKCRRKEKDRERRRWLRKNRGYFRGRYPYLKEHWDYAVYLRGYRAKNQKYVAADNRARRQRKRRAMIGPIYRT